MHGKRACLIVDLRSGDNVVKVPDLIAVLEAAGWKTDVCLKEFSGETLKLAEKAAKDGHDLVIGYGGDGTLNAVVNGVMYAGGKSIIGDIPGGTFNEWASEVSIPQDPVKAALALVNSIPRKVDLGFFEVEGLTIPAHAVHNGQDQQADDVEEKGTSNPEEAGQVAETRETEEIQEKPKKAGKHRQYFLLHAGLGVDAAIMARINKPLKYHVGKLAFDIAGLKELPRQRPFPVEICSLDDNRKPDLQWKGEAWQVIVNNTRRYAGAIDLSPDAYIDDGILDVTVVPAGGPLTTLQEAVSFLLLHTVDNNTTLNFRGPHLTISVPASIELELDGSVVKLKDFLRKKERRALEQVGDADKVMVRYRFDAVLAAGRMAFPCTYDGSMFEKPSHKAPFEQAAQQRKELEEKIAALQQQERERAEQARQNGQPGQAESHFTSQVEGLQKQGRKITVVGVDPNPHQPHTYIIAGTYQRKNDGKVEPTAVCIDDHTLVLTTQGEQVPLLLIENLHEGEQIAVDGKKSKHAVIDANGILLPPRP
ncbi:MAG TPA: diacylglycerol kinase family protein [Ktedonobacteraceae bacterium]|nr:diacylglycerol kinase family protein [Ktedonobacteraceae bacterium]